MTKVVNSIWFGSANWGGPSCIGLVMVKTDYEGVKYYIGCAKGFNQEADEKHIADWGHSFPKNAGDVLFGMNDKELS